MENKVKKTKDQELAELRAKLKTIKKMIMEYEYILPAKFYNIAIRIIESDWQEKTN